MIPDNGNTTLSAGIFGEHAASEPERLDTALVRLGLTESRERAHRLITEGHVRVGGEAVTKPAYKLNDPYNADIELTGGDKYVSRGGIKLEAALLAFFPPEGRIDGLRCCDVGASTGGFTDCLLQHGAKSVVCVDCGSEQLHHKLRADPRVCSLEGVNARGWNDAQYAKAFGLVTMDVSFISQILIFHTVHHILAPGGRLISLIKPQFEAGREALDRHGIVRDPAVHAAVICNVARAAQQHPVELYMRACIPSPITGGDGNREFLALFTAEPAELPDEGEVLKWM